MDDFSHLRNLVLWTSFVDRDREIFIENEAITLGETPASSN